MTKQEKSRLIKIASVILEDELKIVSQELEHIETSISNIIQYVDLTEQKLYEIDSKLKQNKVLINYDDIEYALSQLKEIRNKVGKYSVFSTIINGLENKLRNEYGITKENNTILNNNNPLVLL
jgi:hypothetical protein